MIINLTKKDSLIYKGIGIILIMFHNFFHLVKPNTGENEMDLNVDRVYKLFDFIKTTPSESINVLFSFFGHYGVQIFIFISGYGLALSYKEKIYEFYKRRFINIYKYFIIGIVGYFIWHLYYHKNINLLTIKNVFYKFILIDNFIPTRIFKTNGPWWFFSLILQLYLIFPLLYKYIKKYSYITFVSILILYYILFNILYQPLLNHKLYFLGNFLGHLPEFSLGILLAYKPKIKYPLIILITSINYIYFI